MATAHVAMPAEKKQENAPSIQSGPTHLGGLTRIQNGRGRKRTKDGKHERWHSKQSVSDHVVAMSGVYDLRESLAVAPSALASRRQDMQS